MKHRCGHEDLSAFLDGELRPKERLAVDRHLAGCPNCQSELSRMRQSWELLFKLPTPQASGDFRVRVWEAIGAQDVPRSWRWAWLIHPQSVVAKAALAFGGFLLIWSVGVGAGTGLYVRHIRPRTLLTPIVRLTQTIPANSIFEVYTKRK